MECYSHVVFSEGSIYGFEATAAARASVSAASDADKSVSAVKSAASFVAIASWIAASSFALKPLMRTTADSITPLVASTCVEIPVMSAKVVLLCYVP